MLKLKHLLTCFLLVLIGACVSDNMEEKESIVKEIAAKKLAGVRAIMSMKDSVFESSMDAFVAVTIINNDTTDFRVRTHEIQSAILALTVTNEAGEYMATVPPSVRPKDIEWMVIKPMKAYLTTYDLHIFSPNLPSGRYFVGMKFIPSNKIAFRIE